jgi:hypothetical protein
VKSSYAAVLAVLIAASAFAGEIAAPVSTRDPASDWRADWTETPQWGGRLGFVDSRGDLKVRLRSAPEGEWVVVARRVRSFQLLDWSLAVLDQDATLFTAEGALNAPLTQVAENVCAYQKTLTRVGILQCDGTLLVRESVGLPVRAVAAGVEAFQLLDDRAAFRGADGSLWVQEGGVVGNFHKVADAVTAFQLERGWIAYLEGRTPDSKGTASRLMMAEGPLGLGSKVVWREVARDVGDFEMEIAVDSGAQFERTLRLAVLTNDGVLRLGAGRALPVALKEFDRGAICGLAWSAGRLAYVDARGLKVAHLGAGNWPDRLDTFEGPVSSFRLTVEGTVLYEDERGRGRLFDWRPASGAQDSPTAGLESAPSLQVFDASAELAVDASAEIAGPGVESSSIRPHFLRRPVQAAAVPGSGPTAVRLFSGVPEARPVEEPEQSAMPLAPAAEIAPKLLQNGVPLYQLYHAGSTDHFYTTKTSDRDFAKSLGFADQGIAAYVEPTQVAGTLPFWRFYSGGQTDHFYTTSSSEYYYVVANGFTFEGNEGYLYGSAVAGTVPLYRLSWWNPSNNDLDHYYTTSDSTRASMTSQGWTYDRVAGYVWPASAPPPTQGTPLYRWYSTGSTDHFYSVTNYATIRGFSQQGIAGYMAPGPGPSALPFRRFYKGAPQTEHFYTTSASEASFVVSTLGYVEEGTGEGYLYTSQQAGTVPLYRLWWCSPSADCDHIWTAWTTERDQLIAAGWGLDGIVGYVGMPPGSPPPPPTVPKDNAAFVSQSVPGLMTVGQASNVSITMRNTGTTTWTQAAGYQLVSWNPQGNLAWGAASVALPATVSPNATVTFAFAVTPAASGKQNFQWQIVRGGSSVGTPSQNVSVAVDKNPSFIVGLTPFADNYIRYFDSLSGGVPPQISTRFAPYRGIECPTPYPTTSACYPGVPAWTRDASFFNPVHPCTAGVLMPQNFTAAHARRNIGPDIHGVTWTPVGRSTYGPINWPPPCDVQVLQITGFCHAPTELLFWLDIADPIIAVSTSGASYCPKDKKWTTRYAQGTGVREVFPGEVTPDSYAMVPNWPPDFAQLGTHPNPWRAYVPAGHQVTSDQSAAKGDMFWLRVPPAGTSIPILGATLFGGGSGPKCLPNALRCEYVSDRAKAQQLPDGTWAITITGYMTGVDTIFGNSRDAIMDLTSLSGIPLSNATVDAIQNWMIYNNVTNPILFGHSLGAMDATVLYQRGFGSQLVLFSAPWVLPPASLAESPSNFSPGPRPVVVYSGQNDTISNMIPEFSGCGFYTDACRLSLGINLVEVFTGGGFLSLQNPHDRCQYEPFYFGAGQCPF